MLYSHRLSQIRNARKQNISFAESLLGSFSSEKVRYLVNKKKPEISGFSFERLSEKCVKVEQVGLVADDIVHQKLVVGL